MNRIIVINVFFITILTGFSAVAGTVQDFGKWEKGELLLENHSFEEDLAAWTLEDGTGNNRGGLYTWEIDTKNPQHGKKCLKVIGHKATGTNWHAKVKQLNASMKGGREYTVIFWARAEKPRQVSLNIQEQQDPWAFWQGGDINLSGPEWEEYSVTFVAKEDVNRNMWVGLAIAQSDVDFWLDSFRFFEGRPEDDLTFDEPFPVDVTEKLTTQWASVKTDRF